MKGTEMLVKNIIAALPPELRDGLTQAITVLPQFATNAQATFQAIDMRLSAIEQNQQRIMDMLQSLLANANDPGVYPAGVGHATRDAALMIEG